MVYAIRHSNHKQQGFTLIEVLVAMIILSIGLLALTALQLSSLKATNESRRVTSITLLAKEMADRMRANPGELANYAGTSVTEPSDGVTTCEGPTANCGPAQLRDYDVNEWIDGLQAIGLVRGSIYRTAGVGNAPDEYTVAIQWDEDRSGALAAATACDATYDAATSAEPGCFKLRFNP